MAKETSANEGRNVAVTNKNTSGIAGDKSVEYIGNFYQLNNETIVEGKTDSYIVLGTDRPSSPSSGYGGEGSSRASAIDIVVGRVSNNFSIQNEISQESGIWLNPDFQNDSARIYLSQKSNIDEYFKIPEGIFRSAKANSSVGIKADNVRFISRETIKLISSTNSIDSTNLNIPGGGVEMIALDPGIKLEDYKYDPQKTYENPPVMQPIPKGENLIRAFEEMTALLEQITGFITQYAMLQSKMNEHLAAHSHIETFSGNQGIPSIEIPPHLFNHNAQVLADIKQSIAQFKMKNLNSFRNKYITKGIESPTYINSKYHFLN